jgi:hypothetical protein
LQQSPQLQYPVTSIAMTVGACPSGGEKRSETHPDHHIMDGSMKPAATASTGRRQAVRPRLLASLCLIGLNMFYQFIRTPVPTAMLGLGKQAAGVIA